MNMPIKVLIDMLQGLHETHGNIDVEIMEGGEYFAASSPLAQRRDGVTVAVIFAGLKSSDNQSEKGC